MQFRERSEFGSVRVRGSILEREGVMKVWYRREVPRGTSQRKCLEAKDVVTDFRDDTLQYILWEVHRPYGSVSGHERSQVAAHDLWLARSGFVLKPNGVCEGPETH